MSFRTVLISLCILNFSFHILAHQVVLNVFVHGTYPFQRILNHKKSPFRRMVYADLGLNPVTNLPSNYQFRLMAQSCCDFDPVQFNMEHFFTWGWKSADVRPMNRIEQGRLLYEAVNNKVIELRRTYDTVLVRLIGFSHGGNVVLNALASMPFSIDGVDVDVVVIGTPIQEHTRDLINSKFVRQAYSIYSMADWIQCIDIQKFHKISKAGAPFFSGRTFNDTDRVLQVDLLVNGKAIGHVQFRTLLCYLAKMLDMVDHKRAGKQTGTVWLNLQVN